MVRLSKKTRDRSVSYKRPKISGKKILSEQKVKVQVNACTGDIAQGMFIPKFV